MTNVIRTLNPLKAWIVESREMQQRDPKRYLAYYPELDFVGRDAVKMTRETFEAIEQNCDRYDGVLPTGQYCGKMFLRGRFLCWYGISRSNPMQLIQINFREIILIDG